MLARAMSVSRSGADATHSESRWAMNKVVIGVIEDLAKSGSEVPGWALSLS